jgi:serine/threonine protein kinase
MSNPNQQNDLLPEHQDKVGDNDFGISKETQQADGTITGSYPFTPGFAAPEIVTPKDAPGVSADIWGWAALVVYAATGNYMFQKTIDEDYITALRTERAPDLNGVPEPYWGALQ